MTGQLDRVDRAVDVPPGSPWLRVQAGRGLIAIDSVRGSDGNHPALAVVTAGDLVVPGRTVGLVLESIGRLSTTRLARGDRDPADPAIARWLAALESAHGHVDADAGADRVGVPEIERRTEALLIAIDGRHRRDAEARRIRLVTEVSGSVPLDADATDELVAVLPGLRTAPPPENDVCAAVADLLGIPLPLGAARGVFTPGQRRVADLDELSTRCARAGYVVRRVRLGTDCRTDLRNPVAAIRDGRLVALLPSWRGTYAVDPTLRIRRRLRKPDLLMLGAEALSPVRELPRRAGWADLRRIAFTGTLPDLGLLVLTAVLAGLASLVLPLASGAIFGSIVPGEQKQRLLVLVVALVGVIAASGCVALLQGRVIARIRTRIDSSSGDAVWARLLRLPVRFFADHGAGELMMRASVVDTVRQLVADSLVSSVIAAVTALSSIVLIATHNWLAGTLTAAVVLLQIGLFSAVLRRWRPLLEMQITGQQRLADLTMETVRGIARIRVFAAEERVFRRLSAAFAVAGRAGFAASRWNAVISAGLAAWSTVGILAVTIGVGANGPDPAEAATYILITTALTQVLAGVSSLISTAGQLIGIRPQIRQLAPLLDELPEPSVGVGGPSSTPTLRGGVELAGVSFGYRPDGPKVLADISFRIEPGEFVAIVGSSGSGRATTRHWFANQVCSPISPSGSSFTPEAATRSRAITDRRSRRVDRAEGRTAAAVGWNLPDVR